MEMLTDLQVIGCDSTNANTGVRGGIIHYMETAVDHPLQWLVYLLHANEFPLRYLFHELDGFTTGAKTTSGTIEKAIQSCELIPVLSFQPITDGDGLPKLPTDVTIRLSKDQQYLYKVINAVRQGHVPLDLARQKPGPLCHSRWLTLACRICGLYVAVLQPEKKMQWLCHFVVTNYSLNWFAIKCKPAWSDAS